MVRNSPLVKPDEKAGAVPERRESGESQLAGDDSLAADYDYGSAREETLAAR